MITTSDKAVRKPDKQLLIRHNNLTNYPLTMHRPFQVSELSSKDLTDTLMAQNVGGVLGVIAILTFLLTPVTRVLKGDNK